MFGITRSVQFLRALVASFMAAFREPVAQSTQPLGEKYLKGSSSGGGSSNGIAPVCQQRRRPSFRLATSTGRDRTCGRRERISSCHVCLTPTSHAVFVSGYGDAATNLGLKTTGRRSTVRI